jgi:NAD(P)-dependent dehydrogenase (short-subunit alcohol dehydrogenase family)
MSEHPDYRTLFDLTGRVALVVGGGSGIGQASALALAAHGARVAVADVEVAKAAETVALIAARQGSAVAHQVGSPIIPTRNSTGSSTSTSRARSASPVPSPR